MNNESKKMSMEELILKSKKVDWGDQLILEGQTCSLMNERITEDIVREILKENKKII